MRDPTEVEVEDVQAAHQAQAALRLPSKQKKVSIKEDAMNCTRPLLLTITLTLLVFTKFIHIYYSTLSIEFFVHSSG